MRLYLRTDRLTLRRFTTDDVDNLFAIEGSEYGEVEYALTRAEWAARSGQRGRADEAEHGTVPDIGF